MIGVLAFLAAVVHTQCTIRWNMAEITEEMLSAQGEDLSLPICLGNFERGDHYGPRSMCPDDAAYMNANNYSIQFEGTPENIALSGVCCKMPADDVLTEEHIYNVSSACPESYVITGSTGHACVANCSVRCTRINTEKYMLGPARPSIFWRITGTISVHSGQGTSLQITWPMIPAGIRHAVGRNSISIWAGDGCVGDPFGSLLVAKLSSDCDGFLYRQVLHKDGSPVKMYPRCDSISSAVNDPECLRN